MNFKDILYEKYNGRAKITINRPTVLNAFTNNTLQELLEALQDSWVDKNVGVIILTGGETKELNKKGKPYPPAFTTGGDQTTDKAAGAGVKAELASLINLPMPSLHAMVLQTIRNIPKPVIAAVNGYAIGGGHVLHVVCDLTIAADNAQFGQVGPRVGSFDAGYGSAYLARVVGEKKAREIWFLCKRYTAKECLDMGLVNEVVPHDELMAAADKMSDTLLSYSPTALAALKASFNADSDSVWGIHSMAGVALNMYYGTEEAAEGKNAFLEKRAPEFGKYRK